MAGQLLTGNTLTTPEATVKKINNITKADVEAVCALAVLSSSEEGGSCSGIFLQVIKEMKASRSVLVARGEVDHLPYLDTLNL